MKPTPFFFRMEQVEADLVAFEELLNSKSELSEKTDILPFFKLHPHLSTFIGLLSLSSRPDIHAYEYQIIGNFACDLLIGSSVDNTYVFIEFEDARKTSIFKTGKRKVPEYSPRFEHGFSQIIDWFCSLDDIKKTAQFQRDFPTGSPTFIGMLIIGRSTFLDPSEVTRLKWRQDKVVINSQHILIYTFDELLAKMKRNALTFKPLLP